MAIQKFPLTTLQKVRQHIKGTLALSDLEQSSGTSGIESVDDLPEPESLDALSGLFTFGGTSDVEVLPTSIRNQWFISTVNPAAALLKLPGLRLKPDLRLVSYLYRTVDSGVGVVWAVPASLSTTAQLEKVLIDSTTMTQVPKPIGALSNFMDALEGDRSPASFLIASMLRRELQEFGALGHRQNWSHHRLIDTVPPKVAWQWRVGLPKDLAPKVKLLPDDQAAVEFFTCRVTAPISIYRHLDQYPSHHYQPTTTDQLMALVQR